MAYASWSVVFGEQPSAAKWNILGTNDAFFDSKVGSGTAWTSWPTPSWTELTIGNATVTAKYAQLGKLVIARISATMGSTSSSTGNVIEVSLPVASIAGYPVSSPIGWVRFTDVSAGAAYHGACRIGSTTSKFDFIVYGCAGTTINEQALPTTVATGDILSAYVVYESV